MEFWIPYGETEIPVKVPDDNFYKILEPIKRGKINDAAVLVSDALAKPVSGPLLSDAVKPGSAAAIIVDPSLPAEIQNEAVVQLKSGLEKAGARTHLFVRKRTSNYPAPTFAAEAKILEPVGETFAEAGQTQSGTKVVLNNEISGCDAKFCLSLTVPHFATGFTGGPENILPGASSLKTISQNRSLMLRGILPPAEAGANLVREDTLDACRRVGPLFSLCFVPDGCGGIEAAFYGEMEPVYRESTARYLQTHNPKVDRKADVVILSAGNVLGSDLYHAVRVLSNVWPVVKKNGTIILVAECPKGIGDASFLEYTRKFQERRELANELRRRFRLGAHVSLFLQESLDNYRVQLVSILPDFYVKNSFRLKPSRTASQAVQQAIRAEGKDAKILLVTRGDLTLPTVASS